MPDEASGLIDGVPPDAPGTREIGFSVPDRYNASAILFDNLMASGYRCAVTGPAGSRTYAELAADACAFGAGLLSLGLRRGDRVLLFLDDTPAYPAAIFGAIRAGLVPLLINTLTPPDLLQFYLADSGSAVAICDRAFIERFNGEACRDTKLQAVVVTNGEGSPPGPVRALSGAEWLGRPPGGLAPADTRRDDMAFWMYSSGSTGRPKIVPLLSLTLARLSLRSSELQQFNPAVLDRPFAFRQMRLQRQSAALETLLFGGPFDVAYLLARLEFGRGYVASVVHVRLVSGARISPCRSGHAAVRRVVWTNPDPHIQERVRARAVDARRRPLPALCHLSHLLLVGETGAQGT